VILANSSPMQGLEKQISRQDGYAGIEVLALAPHTVPRLYNLRSSESSLKRLKVHSFSSYRAAELCEAPAQPPESPHNRPAERLAFPNLASEKSLPISQMNRSRRSFDSQNA